jgi:hypothetical protein
MQPPMSELFATSKVKPQTETGDIHRLRRFRRLFREDVPKEICAICVICG